MFGGLGVSLFHVGLLAGPDERHLPLSPGKARNRRAGDANSNACYGTEVQSKVRKP